MCPFTFTVREINYVKLQTLDTLKIISCLQLYKSELVDENYKIKYEQHIKKNVSPGLARCLWSESGFSHPVNIFPNFNSIVIFSE